MKEQILQWLQQNGVTNPRGLRMNNNFIAFLIGLFPNKTEEEIKKTVLQMDIAYDNIEGFSGGLDIALSNE
jgi:hypothetical protein